MAAKSRIAAGVGRGRLSRDGKRLIATSLYQKGKHFLLAAHLLREKGGYEYVVLHLLCQGVEITLKGLLLLVDYDTHMPKLRNYGHDLLRLTREVRKAFKLPALRPELEAELKVLAPLYSKHLLRYSSPFDILVDPSTIASERVLWRMAAGVRLADREWARATLRGAARSAHSTPFGRPKPQANRYSLAVPPTPFQRGALVA